MTIDKGTLDSFISNYSLQDGETINFDKYVKIITNAERWHGKFFARLLADCFIPSGGRICPGYEDSVSSFTFDYPEFDE